MNDGWSEKRGEHVGFDDTDGQLYTSNSLLFLIRENYKASNEETQTFILLEVFVMKEKIRKFMNEPLTIKRELKINLIAMGIFAIPYAALVIYGILGERRTAKEELDEEDKTRIKKMMKNIYLGK